MKMQGKVLSLGGKTLPSRAYEGDAGFDLTYSGDEPMRIEPLRSADVPCGLAIEWPPGIWGFMVGRSSTFRNRGILVNPGIIDGGFRGELFAVCRNITEGPRTISPGERIAQIIPMLIMADSIELQWADELSESDRGTNGFGSTGH